MPDTDIGQGGMKKFILLAVLTLVSLTLSAQNKNDGQYEHYMDVMIEFGTVMSKNPVIPLVSINDNRLDYIYDTNGEKIKFAGRSSMINYFIKLGWTFVQAVTKGEREMIYFKKMVNNPQEAKEGILYKDDLKK